MRVLVTGGTGFIGSRLVRALDARGDEAIVVSRRPGPGRRVVGDPTRAGDWQRAIDGCDAVVNLAGEPVDQRWTRATRERIRASRVESTRRVVEAIDAARQKPRALVNASAQGYYGFRDDDTEVDESAPAGADFLAEVVRAWEAEAQKAGARVVLVRSGIVLDPKGGALARMLLPFRLFAGGPAGSGRQWMSWIHVADEVGVFLRALDDQTMRGAYNAVAPEPVHNRDFARALGRALGRPARLPAPALALRLVFGEMGEIVLRGARVIPRRLLELPYPFRYVRLDEALADLLQ